MKNKKGIMLGEAFSAVLALILVAVLVIVSIYMFSALKSTPSTTSVSITNESTTLSASGIYLSNYTKCGFESPAITGLRNSSGVVYLTGNVSVNSAGLVSNTSTNSNLVGVLISYNYGWKGDSCVASESMVTQFATFPVLIGLVGTIIFLALVIGVLVTSFMFGRKSGA